MPYPAGNGKGADTLSSEQSRLSQGRAGAALDGSAPPMEAASFTGTVPSDAGAAKASNTQEIGMSFLAGQVGAFPENRSSRQDI